MLNPLQARERNRTSLPTEILAIIVEELVSECAGSSQVKFTPLGLLIPLLQVLKGWIVLCTRHLYRSIEIGNVSPFVFPAGDEESPYNTEERRKHITSHRTQDLRLHRTCMQRSQQTQGWLHWLNVCSSERISFIIAHGQGERR